MWAGLRSLPFASWLLKSILRRTSLSALIVFIGTSSALPSTEGDPTFKYVICSRIIDLLYDLSGNAEADRRQLGSSLGGDSRFRNYILDKKIYAELQSRSVRNRGTEAVGRLGTIDDVLNVYLFANQSGRTCTQSNCDVDIVYDDGIEHFEERIKVDDRSILYGVVPSYPAEIVTGLGLYALGPSKQVIVQGSAEAVSFTQVSVNIPCPTPIADLAKCEESLGYLPQEKMPLHKGFQTVLLDRSRLSSDQKLRDCSAVYQEFRIE